MVKLTAALARMASPPEFGDPVLAKANFGLDHYPVDAGYRPELTVDFSRYWALLFSHNRLGVWKGMLKVELDTAADDLAGPPAAGREPSMSTRAQREFLTVQLAETQQLLERAAGHPVMSVAYTERARALREQLEALPLGGKEAPEVFGESSPDRVL